MRLSCKGWCVFSQPLRLLHGRCLWIRSCGDRNSSWRATVRLGIDTLIANILVVSCIRTTTQQKVKELRGASQQRPQPA